MGRLILPLGITDITVTLIDTDTMVDTMDLVTLRWILRTSLWLWILRMGQIDKFGFIRPFKRGIIILRIPNSKFYNNTTAQDLEINTCHHHFDFHFYICSKLPPEEKKIS